MSEPKRTNLEIWAIGAVEAGFPEGTEDDKRRLAILLVQARAQEARNLSTMFAMNNPRNTVVLQMAKHMMNREHRLEEIGLAWATGPWPPNEGSTEGTEGQPLVTLQ